MLLSEALKLYELNTKRGTYTTHCNKIKEYISLAGDLDIVNSLNQDILANFIFKGDQSAKGKYSALVSFYKYIHTEINKLPKDKFTFPIHQNEAVGFDNKHGPYETSKHSSRGSTLYLEQGFNFNELFSDTYYSHLKNSVASITVKAAIALALGAGYDSGEMFITNTIPKMKLNDPIFEDMNVWVKNYTENSPIEYIGLNTELSNYIREYYNIRKSCNNVAHDEKNIFFAKLWDTYELHHDNKIEQRKPYMVQSLILYMLKYISKNINLKEHLTVTDLKSNMVLHSLYNTKGSSLKQIIKTFGFVPFVQDAFDKYCENEANNYCTLFNDESFFQISPSETEPEFNTQASGGETNKTDILTKRILRDNKIVKDLKSMYNNTCQICGVPLSLIDNLSYSEACHIQPLGGIHKGIDTKENIIILCPNHHKLFDLGIFTIDPDTLDKVLYIDPDNPLHNKKLISNKHKLSPIFVRYHYENIFLPLRNEINNY